MAVDPNEVEERPITAADIIEKALKLAPWISASLSDLKPGHTGEYQKDAEEFLEAVEWWEK